MPQITRNDLLYTHYSWKAKEGDNPRLRGTPDNDLLNREEGYEVLDFINDLAKRSNFAHKISSLRVEWMIHEHLPSDVRGRRAVNSWIAENWKPLEAEWNRKVARGDIPG